MCNVTAWRAESVGAGAYAHVAGHVVRTRPRVCVMCVLVAEHACASGEERGETECLCTQDVCAKGGLKGYAVIGFFF